MNMKWKVAFVGALMAGASLTACVDQQASILMKGSVVGDAEEEGFLCSYNMDMDAPGLVYTQGFVDLESLSTIGQPRTPLEGSVGAANVYEFAAMYQNQLVDSRQVGAEGGGGGGGGFSNLPLNQNDVIVTSATVTFPADDNTFGFAGGAAALEDVEYERVFSMLVRSGGGVGVNNIPLINGQQEADLFRDFLTANSVTSRPLTFVAEIQLQGETMAGNDVESNIFRFPIQICVDCGARTQPLCTTSVEVDDVEEEE